MLYVGASMSLHSRILPCPEPPGDVEEKRVALLQLESTEEALLYKNRRGSNIHRKTQRKNASEKPTSSLVDC